MANWSSPANEALSQIGTFVKTQRVEKKAGECFAEFERALHKEVMKFERELLKEELERADVADDVIRVEGIDHRRVLRAEQRYMTAAGEVCVERALHKDRTDPGAQCVCAMELRTGIVAGFWTPLAAEQALWLVSQMTPQVAEDLLKRLGNMTPSKASLDRLPKEIAARWEEQRVEFEADLRATTTVPAEATTIVISLDGVYAPMKDTDPVATRECAAAAGKIAKGPAGYREVGCATIALCDGVGKTLSAIRFARMPETKKETLKSMLSAEVDHLMVQRSKLVQVAVADGVDDNWTYLEATYPQAFQVVDFFHAAEHLNAAIAAVYGDGTKEARRRFAALRSTLLEEDDGVEAIIRALDYLHRKHRNKAVKLALGYFRKHRARMRYAALRARGLPIGSGVVEAACKTLVTQRMKNSGMRWSQLGGQAILNPRGWIQSERFEAAWALVAATYRMKITLLNNVVPFPRRAA